MRQSYQILILCFAIIIALLIYTLSANHDSSHASHLAWEKYEDSFTKLKHISNMLIQVQHLTRLYVATTTSEDDFEMDELIMAASATRSNYIKHYLELEKLPLDAVEKQYLERINQQAGKLRLAQLSYDERLIQGVVLEQRLKLAIDTIISPQNQTQAIIQNFLNYIRTKTISDSSIFQKHDTLGHNKVTNLQLTTIYLTFFLAIFAVLVVFRGQKTISDKNDSLSKAESFQHSILNSTPVALIITDHSGQIIMTNNNAVALFEYSRDTLVGMNVSDLIPEPVRHKHAQHILSYASNPTSREMFTGLELTAQRQSGDIFPIEVGLSPVDGQDKLYIACSVKDITRQKAMEHEILENQRKAEHANLAKSEFLANVSHELRTPLHAILSFSRLGLKNSQPVASEPRSDLKLHNYFKKIQTSGNKLLNFINDLLDSAKFESGKMELHFAPYDIGHLVESFINEQEAILLELELECSISTTSYEHHAQFDKHSIGQAINNLFANAIKYSPRGGHINISITSCELKDAPAIQFAIQDEGAGIPEAQLSSIFEKFIQSSNTLPGGTGLGLSLSKNIIQAHGGRIWAENHVPKGTIFSFIIPVEQPDSHLTQPVTP